VRRFELDAAIVFSDILIVLEAMGRKVVFEKGEGPQVDPIRDEAGARALARPDVDPPANVDPSAPATSWRSHREALFSRWVARIGDPGLAP